MKRIGFFVFIQIVNSYILTTFNPLGSSISFASPRSVTPQYDSAGQYPHRIIQYDQYDSVYPLLQPDLSTDLPREEFRLLPVHSTERVEVEYALPPSAPLEILLDSREVHVGLNAGLNSGVSVPRGYGLEELPKVEAPKVEAVVEEFPGMLGNALPSHRSHQSHDPHQFAQANLQANQNRVENIKTLELYSEKVVFKFSDSTFYQIYVDLFNPSVNQYAKENGWIWEKMVEEISNSFQKFGNSYPVTIHFDGSGIWLIPYLDYLMSGTFQSPPDSDSEEFYRYSEMLKQLSELGVQSGMPKMAQAAQNQFDLMSFKQIKCRKKCKNGTAPAWMSDKGFCAECLQKASRLKKIGLLKSEVNVPGLGRPFQTSPAIQIPVTSDVPAPVQSYFGQVPQIYSDLIEAGELSASEFSDEQSFSSVSSPTSSTTLAPYAPRRIERKLCLTRGCEFYGSIEYKNHCSGCYLKKY